MNNYPQKKNVSLQQVLAVLLDESSVFPPAYLRYFSDLEGPDLEAVRSVWPQVKPGRRLALLEDLEELAEADTLVSFDNFARVTLEDPDPRVRTVAIRLLWENNDPRLASTFINMLENDPDPGVRAAAANALGQFIYLGEIEEIPADVLHRVEESLLKVMAGAEDELTRRRALESLGFSSRPEVPDLIRAAYDSNDADWMSSALYAMGRSADNAWAPEVMRMLRHPKANVQLEAVRAAGSLELDRSRRILLDLLEEEAQDSELRAAVFWSLSQIGGEEVRETLETILEETEDDEEAEILEEALDNLSFTEDVDLFGLFDFANAGQSITDPEDLDRGLEEDGSENPDDGNDASGHRRK
ncbi:MAG: HEAT repeat domain-containing protein [Chloroflexi bacterium]|nr:MAG: HEAT repeat domain-containing protein [Chloroflexota bacterium]